jgi:D-alanine-D-alanine ligase
VFVKPPKEGSSYGISPARSREELTKAVALAREYDRIVIAESLIDGDEFSVSILGKTILPAVEIVNHAEFYDFEAKYESDKTEYICPARLDEKTLEQVNQFAAKAFDALGCRIWGRIDFMKNRTGDVFLLEANTVPGMTDHSLVPMAAKSAGLSYEALVLEVLALSKVSDRG